MRYCNVMVTRNDSIGGGRDRLSLGGQAVLSAMSSSLTLVPPLGCIN